MAVPNIVFVRIDNRLIHGQVGNAWATSCGCNLIIVVDDETVLNPLQQSLMKMTADAVGIGVRFFSVKKTLEIINKAAPSQKIFIVARTPMVIEELVKGGLPIKSCCIGNMHPSEGKKSFHDIHVYVDAEDLACFERLKALGVELYIQIAPIDTRYVL